jgi:hypothetical protein
VSGAKESETTLRLERLIPAPPVRRAQTEVTVSCTQTLDRHGVGWRSCFDRLTKIANSREER